jgi:GTPase SAR1 family protein
MNSSLQYIDLSENEFGDNGCKELALAFAKHSNLQKIDLSRNRISADACAFLVHSIVAFEELNYLNLDCEPAEVVNCRQWMQLQLPRLDPGVLRLGWIRTLAYVREFLVGDNVPVYDMRLMVVGASMAGKTTLVRALASSSGSTERISLEDRSPALDISSQKLQLPGNNGDESDTIQCRLWDFGGHEVFYLSHTMHFTGRCLYLLTWSPVKHVDDVSDVELSIEEVTAPLKKWIRILALHAPESYVVLVGTHSTYTTAGHLRGVVRDIVSAEAAGMVKHARREAKQLHQTLESLLSEVEFTYLSVVSLLRKHHPHLVPNLKQPTRESLVLCSQQLVANLEHQHVLHPSLKRQVDKMNTNVSRYESTVERLRIVYGIRDGRLPPKKYTKSRVTKLELLEAYIVDSLNDAASIHLFKNGLNKLLRSKSVDPSSGESTAVFPFIGELQPRWYNDVLSELRKQKGGKFIWGDSVVSLADACNRLVAVTSISRQTLSKLEWCLKFHHLLGNVFVFKDHFLRDPALLIELVKPLVHYKVSEIPVKFFTADSKKQAARYDQDLKSLQDTSELSLGLLRCLNAWNASCEGSAAFLDFFKSCYMLSDIPGQPETLLVTARLANRQFPPALVADIHETALFHAFYLVPLNHVGFMAQFMSAITSKRPQGLAVSVRCGSDAVCVRSDGRSCCISVMNAPHNIEISSVSASCFRTSNALCFVDGQRILFVGDDVPFEIDKRTVYVAVVTSGARHFQVRRETGNQNPVKVSDVEQCTFCVVCLQQDQNPADLALQLPACQRHIPLKHRLGVALRISANDMGFFAFAVELADQLMISGAFSMRYQCWVPCVVDGAVQWHSFHDNSFPMELPPAMQQVVLLDSLLSALRDHRMHISLHKALQKRAADVALFEGKVLRRHLFSRSCCSERHRVFMSCSYEDDGTLKFSRHFQKRLQDQALLSCWYQHEGSDQEVADAMRHAAAIFIFLSPQYLLQDRCLKQLVMALKLCSGSSSKKLHVICTHPAVSHRSRANIVKRVRAQQKSFVFVKEYAAMESSSDLFYAYEILESSAALLQLLNERESQELSDEWMHFRCWNSSEKKWKEEHLSLGCKLRDKICSFVKREAFSYKFDQASLSAGLDADGTSAPTKLLTFGDTTLATAIQELYPDSITLFGLKNWKSVLELAVLGLSDHEIVEHAAIDSELPDSNASSALDVAFASSGVDFKDARYMNLVVEANLHGVLQDSKCFNDWIKGPVPENKVVCRVEGTDDVMLFHALLMSSRATGFVRKPTRDSIWSDFTYAHDGNKELRLCAQKLDIKNIQEHDRQGVLENPFDIDLEVVNVCLLSESKANMTWLFVSDNDLKASSTSTGGTLRCKDSGKKDKE